MGGVFSVVFDAVFCAVAFSFDDDGFAVVHDAVEDGGGDGGVVVEGLLPFLVDAIGGDDGGGVFVASGDDLEE